MENRRICIELSDADPDSAEHTLRAGHGGVSNGDPRVCWVGMGDDLHRGVWADFPGGRACSLPVVIDDEGEHDR